jgi:CubicO group peptidase (beta-lactamase class C family)
MTDGNIARRQFRVLHREFLFRVIDRELLSSHAQGDSSKLLLQFVSLLIFIGLVFCIPAWSFDKVQPAQVQLMYAWSLEHFFIATTMLVIGLFAVLIWDSLFPDRRDVLVLAPLPIRTRTIFLAKLAAIASALGLAVGSLHLAAGLVWPLRLSTTAPAFTMPAFTSDPVMPPVAPEAIQATLDHDLAEALRDNSALRPGGGGGLVIGISTHATRQIFTYGAAAPDSLFEIGSITKTFTATLLAHLTAQGVVRLDEPVRDLLPADSIGPPVAGGQEITLRDLVTHHSGLPVMDPYYRSGDPVNPYAGYSAGRLYAYLTSRGLQRPAQPPFVYSNLGVGLLGHALTRATGKTYATLVHSVITGPLGMSDTTIALSDDQQRRFIQGYDVTRTPMPVTEVGVLAGAGRLVSSANDMLTWLEANLAAERTHTGPLAADLAMTHRPQADAGPEMRVALAWFYGPSDGTYGHDGATFGHTADAYFDPAHDTAAIVLSNVHGLTALSANMVGGHLRARFSGKSAVAIKDITLPAKGSLVGVLRMFAAYWITMFAAGAFVFCAVMCVQGLAAQILPRRYFLRASSFLQLGAFTLIVGVYCLQAFAISIGTLIRSQDSGLFASLPSLWFLALFQAISGSPAMAPLVRNAWLGLAIVAVGAGLMYALSYFRNVRRIVEEADIMPGSPGARWLPSFGSPLSTAIGQFSVRTLLRSPQHRVILAFYWGIGFAVAIFFLKTPRRGQAAADAAVAAGSLWQDPNVPMLVSLLIMGLAVLGTRVAFSLPRDLRSNWIFRITPVEGGAPCVNARRRALAALSVVPVWTAAAALFLIIWPWASAVGHLIVLALFGMVLVEISLQHGVQKIPFTCAYLPGKSTIHATLWLGLLVLLPLTAKGAEIELRALQDAGSYATMLAVLGGVWAVARLRTAWLARAENLPPQFEEESPDEMVTLNVWDSASLDRASRSVRAAPSVRS